MSYRSSKYINNQISEDLKKGKSLFKDASDEELHKITEKSQEPPEKLKAQLESSNRKWNSALIKWEERDNQIEAAVKDLSPLSSRAEKVKLTAEYRAEDAEEKIKAQEKKKELKELGEKFPKIGGKKKTRKRGGVKRIRGKKEEQIIHLMGYRWDHNAKDYELGQIIEFLPPAQKDIERVRVVLSDWDEHLDEHGNPGKYFDTITDHDTITNQYIESESEEEDGYKTPTKSEEVKSMEGPSTKKPHKKGGLRKTRKSKKSKKSRRKRRNTRKKRS